MKKSITCFLLCIFIFASFSIKAQITKELTTNKVIDSLLQVIKTNTSLYSESKPAINGRRSVLLPDTTKIKTLVEISQQYLNITNYNKALQYAQHAMQQGEVLIKVCKGEAETYSLKKGIAEACRITGIINRRRGNYQRGINSFLKSLKINEEIENKTGIGDCYNNLGSLFWDQGNYEKSFFNHLKSLKIREAMSDKKKLASSYNNIGLLYSAQGNNMRALDYCLNGLKIIKSTVLNKSLNASLLNSSGQVYFQMRNYTKAMECYTQALVLQEEIEDKYGIADTYLNIGRIYFAGWKPGLPKRVSENEGHQLALDCYFKSLKINQESGNVQGASDNYLSIGEVYMKQRKFEESYGYFTKSLALAKKIGYKDGIKNGYSILSGFFEQKGDFKNALDYQDLFTDIKDSLTSEKSGKKIAEMCANYESDKKKDAIQLLNKEKRNQANLATSESKKNQVILLSVSGFGLFLLGFAIFMFRNLRQRYFLNMELEKLSIVASETDNGILICDPFGKLEWVNPAYVRFSGYSFEEIKQRGSTLEEISTYPEIRSLIQQSIEHKKTSVYESMNISKNGARRWLQSTLTPILDDRGDIQNLVVVDTDISEKRAVIEKLNEKNNDLTNNINYARRIQRAVLPHRKEIWKTFPESFVLYKPKDIVSGDFYFFYKTSLSFWDGGGNIVFIAAADCTGHGIPGAFMSLIGAGKLSEACHKSHEPSVILSRLNMGIKTTLKQTENVKSTRDGMDIALCSVNTEKRIVKYAGANRAIWIIRKGQTEVEEIKATKKAIGGFTEDTQHFTTHEIQLQEGDTFYLCTDGYADTFNGKTDKKMTTKKFKEVLLSIRNKTMKEQEHYLDNFVEEWKAGTEQVDDILVIGIRL